MGGTRLMVMEVPGQRTGRAKRLCLDSIKHDFAEKG